MDYQQFQRRGSEDWEGMGGLLGRIRSRGLRSLDHAELERLAALHRRIISDYAYARTHFQGTAAELRLQRLAFGAHRLLAHPEQPWPGRLRAFYRHGFPATFRLCMPAIGVSLSVFLVAALLGFLITALHTDFALLFLGPDAIEGVRNGEIWTDSVGSITPHSLLSAKIFTNNMTVALTAWAGGALLGIGSLYVVFFNGIMLGGVIGLCWQYDLLDRLWAWVAAHGPLEILLIIVASGAGLVLAQGMVVATNGSRQRSIQRHARRSMHLVLGVLPWLVLLGVVEGFLSPLMNVATPWKAAVGLLLVVVFMLHVLSHAPTPPETTP
jgi:uncharacterized membrane protein SpoIIM required for sporulation